eukprot:GILK01007351.1.p1 GENE.GILK01007351.1~~GILK01007351.1.p1  ORF type:complete len:222 (+),score=44.82 GILK01007351.1:35-667(+)
MDVNLVEPVTQYADVWLEAVRLLNHTVLQVEDWRTKCRQLEKENLQLRDNTLRLEADLRIWKEREEQLTEMVAAKDGELCELRRRMDVDFPSREAASAARELELLKLEQQLRARELDIREREDRLQIDPDNRVSYVKSTDDIDASYKSLLEYIKHSQQETDMLSNTIQQLREERTLSFDGSEPNRSVLVRQQDLVSLVERLQHAVKQPHL